MKIMLAVCVLAMPLAAQEYKIAVIGLVHSHVWGQLPAMLKGDPAKLVGIAETIPDLIEEAKKRGAASVPFYSDYRKLLDEARPDIVWAFVENNRHLEIVAACAPRKIHVIFEKPLASTHRDALAIQKLARKHSIEVMTNYQMAWWPSQYAAKAEVDAGAVGPVWRVRGIVGHGGPGSGGTGKYFFDWLTDPEKNGAGALMDFGCYNALWALWYLGRPQSVYAHSNQLRPETFPKVEDNSTVILSYKNGVAILEGSWDLPRGFQDLELFGLKGSVYMRSGSVEVRAGRTEPRQVPLQPLAPERSAPIAYLVHCLRDKKPVEGLVAIDINVAVNEIIEAAKQSIKSGKAVPLPPKSS